MPIIRQCGSNFCPARFNYKGGALDSMELYGENPAHATNCVLDVAGPCAMDPNVRGIQYRTDLTKSQIWGLLGIPNPTVDQIYEVIKGLDLNCTFYKEPGCPLHQVQAND